MFVEHTQCNRADAHSNAAIGTKLRLDTHSHTFCMRDDEK